MTARRQAIVFEVVATAAFTGAGLLIWPPLGLIILGLIALLAAYTLTKE